MRIAELITIIFFLLVVSAYFYDNKKDFSRQLSDSTDIIDDL